MRTGSAYVPLALGKAGGVGRAVVTGVSSASKGSSISTASTPICRGMV